MNVLKTATVTISLLIGLSGCALTNHTNQQATNTNMQEINLYNGLAPGLLDPLNREKIRPDLDKTRLFLMDVTHPTLTAFFPENPNGTAIIICPGGGYKGLSVMSEGADIAKRLNTLGVTAFVLKYRIPQDNIMQDKTIAPLQDVQQAINMVRQRSKEWSIKPNKVGVMGFSAGGHLAASSAVHYPDAKLPTLKNVNLRPDFQMLVYPVVSFTDEIGHKGSRKNLLGNATAKQIAYFSNENHITIDTPPAFIVHAADDKAVVVENSITYFQALKAKNVATELLILPSGGHGFGLKNNYDWFNNLSEWLANNHLLTN